MSCRDSAITYAMINSMEIDTIIIDSQERPFAVAIKFGVVSW